MALHRDNMAELHLRKFNFSKKAMDCQLKFHGTDGSILLREVIFNPSLVQEDGKLFGVFSKFGAKIRKNKNSAMVCLRRYGLPAALKIPKLQQFPSLLARDERAGTEIIAIWIFLEPKN
mmetsp:Transcript_23551/g.35248  ORF Transcript_23551/g.35248 Transcript_23551/m.35248 type:complete len:119 (+) Transcript_23551:937-1293(+)